MKQLLSLFLVMLCFSVQAEKVSNKSGRATGNFEIARVNAPAIQANYAVFPGGPESIVVAINPTHEFVLNAHVVNTKGQEQITFKPETVMLRYANKIDVSKLARGDYFFEILFADGTTYRIPFSKE